MVITDHLIIYLQLLTGRVCACIRIDRTCTHRTICTIMVTTELRPYSAAAAAIPARVAPKAPAPAQAAAARARGPLGQHEQHYSSCSSNLLAFGAAPNGGQHRRIAYPRGDRDEAVLHVLRSPRDSNLTWNATSQQLWLLQLAAIVCCCERRGPNRPGI